MRGAVTKTKKPSITPATIVHCHKVALALVGIGHLIVQKTKVDLSSAGRQRGRNTERKGEDQMRKSEDTPEKTSYIKDRKSRKYSSFLLVHPVHLIHYPGA